MAEEEADGSDDTPSENDDRELLETPVVGLDACPHASPQAST